MNEQEITLTENVRSKRNQILGLVPTKQARAILALEFPEAEEDILPMLIFLREGAMGQLSKYENVRQAYESKYDLFMDKAADAGSGKELEALAIPQPKGRVFRMFLGLIIIAAAVWGVASMIRTLRHSGRDSVETTVVTDNANAKEITAPVMSADEAIAQMQAKQKEVEEALAAQTAGATSESAVEMKGNVDKYPVEMTLSIVGGTTIEGSYFYTKTGSGHPITLRGTCTESMKYSGSTYYDVEFYEYDDKGNRAGKFAGILILGPDDTHSFDGGYTSVKGKEMPVFLD